jgi:hypothetical protein
MIRANDNMKFELKRVTYTIQMFKRDDIVKDISRINTLLRNTLADQDSICTSTIQEITEILETRWLHLSTDAICLAMHVCSLALRISALGPVQRAHGYRSGYARQLLSQRSISRTTAVGYILTLCDIFRSPTTTTIVAATEESSSLGPIRPFLGRKI